MAMSSGGGGGVQSTPNVTPMIDVMLVLLIIFMVVTPQLLAGFTAEMTYVSKEMIDYLIKGVSGEFGRSRFTREFNAQAGGAGPIAQ